MGLQEFQASIQRLGVALEPEGEFEEEGILNPASAIDRQGRLLLYPRAVARGNISRVGIVAVEEQPDGTVTFKRQGFALEPETADEKRPQLAGGEGCEDPRVTFVAPLNKYLMGYTKYGPQGPRIGIACSDDAYTWTRLPGHVEMPRRYRVPEDDKDVAFFPEVVLSPSGEPSIAFFHRPMAHIPVQGAFSEVESVLSLPPRRRQSIRIAYVPLAAAKKDLNALLRPKETKVVVSPSSRWGKVKVGIGSAPVRIAEGWLVLYHGVDAVENGAGRFAMRYCAGLLVLDAQRPDKVLYRSPRPLYSPETPEELTGTVNDVVFPTALIARPSSADPSAGRQFDIYDGVADYRISRKRLCLSA